ncbi:FUSC family protein [Bacillus sp. BRMEA1]|uniref:FUSC family protein n=1 Tax=Neobacillus endophyticus TaxID=2738405 RepID=UPI0015663CA7|nr:aromatic acid exporter family protein [Neobacillus endophyticus]NRD79287.1 FUSC family protein [Neobacillus endophyticus]
MVIQTYRQLKEEMVFKRMLIWKMAIASALSWEIARFCGSDHPYLAPSTVIVCLQTTINRSLKYSYHRVGGTLIGILVADLLVPHLDVNALTLGLIILIGGFITKWMKLDESTIHQAALAVVLIFVIGHKSGDYPLDRFRNTLIGALTACIVHMLLFPPNFIKQAEKSVYSLKERLTDVVNQVSNWVDTGFADESGDKLGKEMEQVLIDLHHSHNIIQDTMDSLKYNFFSKKSKMKLQELNDQIQFISLVYSYLANLIEIFQVWSAKETITTSHQIIWVKQLKALISYFQNGIDESARFPEEQLLVQISSDLEKQQFHISLYQETKSLLLKLEDLKKADSS